MLLCLNANGTIVQEVAEPIYQGSNNASTIYFVAPITPEHVAQLSFTLPNGKKTKPYTVFPISFFPYQNSDKVIYCWKWSIPEAITAYAGTVKGQISFLSEKSVSSDIGDSVTYNYAQTISSAEFEFEVEQGAQPAFPDENDDAYYENFITALHNFLQTISGNFDTFDRDITQLQEDMPLIVDEVLRLNNSEIEDGYANSIDEGSLNKTPSIGESALVLVQTKQSGNIYTAKMTITENITTDEKGNNFYPFELSEVYLLHNGTTDSDVETILGDKTAQEYKEIIDSTVDTASQNKEDMPLILEIVPEFGASWETIKAAYDSYKDGTNLNAFDDIIYSIIVSGWNKTPTIRERFVAVGTSNDNCVFGFKGNISKAVDRNDTVYYYFVMNDLVLLHNDKEIPLVYNGVISLANFPNVGVIVRLSVTDFNKSPVPGERFWALAKQTNTIYAVKCSVISNNGSILEAGITEGIQLHDGNTDKLVRTAWQSRFDNSNIYNGNLDYLYSPGSYYIYDNAKAPDDASGNRVDGLLQVIEGPVDSQLGMQILFGNNSKIYMRMLNEDMIWTQWQSVGLDTTKKFLSFVPLPSLPDITDQQVLDSLDKSAIYVIPNNDDTPNDDNNCTEYVLVNIGTEQAPNWKWEVFGTMTSGVNLKDYATKDFVNEKVGELKTYTDNLVNSSHVVNITTLATMYDSESALEGVIPPEGNGARYIVKTNGGLPLFYYSYNASENKWDKSYQIKGSTLYLNLADACLYRFTQTPNTDTYPYFIKITYTKAETEAMIRATFPSIDDHNKDGYLDILIGDTLKRFLGGSLRIGSTDYADNTIYTDFLAHAILLPKKTGTFALVEDVAVVESLANSANNTANTAKGRADSAYSLANTARAEASVAEGKADSALNGLLNFGYYDSNDLPNKGANNFVVQESSIYLFFSSNKALKLCQPSGIVEKSGYNVLLLFCSPYKTGTPSTSGDFAVMGLGVGETTLGVPSIDSIQVNLNSGAYVTTGNESIGFAVTELKKGV